jgi:hypothetical protein
LLLKTRPRCFAKRMVMMMHPSKKSLARKNNEMAFYCGRIASARFFATTVLPTVKSRCLILEQGELTL